MTTDSLAYFEIGYDRDYIGTALHCLLCEPDPNAPHWSARILEDVHDVPLVNIADAARLHLRSAHPYLPTDVAKMRARLAGAVHRGPPAPGGHETLVDDAGRSYIIPSPAPTAWPLPVPHPGAELWPRPTDAELDDAIDADEARRLLSPTDPGHPEWRPGDLTAYHARMQQLRAERDRLRTDL